MGRPAIPPLRENPSSSAAAAVAPPPPAVVINRRGGQRRYWEIESSSSPAAKRQYLESPEKVNFVINRKLCVSLTKDEIEEDFMEIARMRPPRRPKKRPRIVQKYMDVRN
ncbi:hypothetical protein LINPERPRIM_LOCUS12726 [Linum perenne]